MSHEYCPTCMRPFVPELRVTGRERRRLVDIVASRPEGVSRSELADSLYADRIVDAPETLNAISMLVMLANRQGRSLSSVPAFLPVLIVRSCKRQ